MKTICCTVTNDIHTDQRVLRISATLAKMGFHVTILGRKLPNSPTLTVHHAKCIRYRMLFTKGPFFYSFFNIRVFFGVLFRAPSIIWSNDMDTLPACYLAALILRRPLIFDSHELFSEVPELYHRKRVKNFWVKLENMLIPRIDVGITVCDSIAFYYKQKYGKTFYVLRNVPYKNPIPEKSTYTKVQHGKKQKSEKRLMYQGVLNVGRGIEKMILAMHYLKGMHLHIAGTGDIEQDLKDLVVREKLTGQVTFHGRLAAEELNRLTPQADLGLSLEENLGLNYYYALPNKLFAYIQAGIPVLVSDFPEMKRLVETYRIGKTTGPVKPEKLANNIEDMLKDHEQYALWLQNLTVAARELCWENEELTLKAIMENGNMHH